MEKKNYSKLDWGTASGTPLPMEKVEVQVGVNLLAKGYVHAMINYLDNHASRLQEKVQLTEDELEKLLNFTLSCRCQQVAGTLKRFGRLKALWIPSFWQFILSCVGEYRNRQYAIDVVPVMAEECTVTYEEAKRISDKLGEFEDVLHMDRAAMPISPEGSEEVMSSALIANCVRSMKHDLSPISQYAVAFADLTLKKEATFSALYRTTYDDLTTIALQANHRDLL